MRVERAGVHGRQCLRGLRDNGKRSRERGEDESGGA
jgi:hypothetical protein